MRKYRNKPCEIDGIRFDSQAEGRRYEQLKLLERAGEIREITLQPKFPIVVNGRKIGRYTADFAYFDRLTGKRVYEDVKGVKTQVYKLRKKLVEALHDVTITEVVRP
jgi:hypothetical protein